MKDARKAIEALRIDAKGKVKLRKIATDSDDGVADKQDAKDKTVKAVSDINIMQQKFYAEASKGLLIVFQALDTGGKDGVVRNVFGPLNPQGVTVTSFKRPSLLESMHDYLWRVHPFIPPKGMIRLFNRSHYEDVLVHRVHNLIPKSVLEKRYRQINDFERYLTENDVIVLKFFLHISKEEQKARLESRLADPDKRWKFEMGDLKERDSWERYQEAYEAVLEKCSQPDAPWYVVPADKKWYRDWVVAETVRHTLKKLDPKFPKEQEGLDQVTVGD